MLTIKFSHKYTKLKLTEGSFANKAKLLNVINVKLEELPQCFLDYDTDNGLFQLPTKGEYMMLMFLRPDCALFTTIRRFTPEKFKYYKNAIGQTFKIDYPPSEHQTEIELTNQEVRE